MNVYNYILNEKGDAIVERDLLTWARWFEDAKNRVLCRTKVGKYDVSTVFLGLDYQFGDGPPVLWETMVFSRRKSTMKFMEKPIKYHKNLDEYTRRYHTRDEAEKGHQEVIKEVEARLKEEFPGK